MIQFLLILINEIARIDVRASGECGASSNGIKTGDDQAGVIDVGFEVVESSRYVSPTALSEAVQRASRRVVRVPMEDFLRGEETALNSCSRMLLSEPTVELGPISIAAAVISSKLRFFTLFATQRAFNWMQVKVELHIVRFLQGSPPPPPPHRLPEQPPQAPSNVGLGVYSADERRQQHESMDDDNNVHPSSSSAYMHDGVEAFLASCRAQTWDSNTQCIICLECLGAGLLLQQEDRNQEEKAGGSGNKEIDAMICELPCSHISWRVHQGMVSRERHLPHLHSAEQLSTLHFFEN